jgi:hypothetical protein
LPAFLDIRLIVVGKPQFNRGEWGLENTEINILAPGNEISLPREAAGRLIFVGQAGHLPRIF